jgi:hypothetical protein
VNEIPIVIKRSKDTPLPEGENLYYVIASNGVFRVRKTQWFESCVKTDKLPGELEAQEEQLIVNFPKIPKALLEKTVGFFRWAFQKHSTEAVMLLVLNRDTNQVFALCPEQTGFYHKGWNNSKRTSADVKYKMPVDIPGKFYIFGTIHSHCDFSAYSSPMDKEDEKPMAGVHITVGHVNTDPQLHIEAVVDGVRFKTAENLVLEGFEKADSGFPDSWKKKLVAKEYVYQGSCHQYSKNNSAGGYYTSVYDKATGKWKDTWHPDYNSGAERGGMYGDYN